MPPTKTRTSKKQKQFTPFAKNDGNRLLDTSNWPEDKGGWEWELYHCPLFDNYPWRNLKLVCRTRSEWLRFGWDGTRFSDGYYVNRLFIKHPTLLKWVLSVCEREKLGTWYNVIKLRSRK